MKQRPLINLLFAVIMMAAIHSCATIPDGAVAVKSFDKAKYLGKWYEIARIDFKYERDLNNTTAEYSLNDDGTIKVNNQGYNTKKGEWAQSIGKAKFIGSDDIAMLKVSFFGPFYSGYNVIEIDDGYKYALVAGKNHEYLWILSRETSIPDDVKERYLTIAKEAGYDTDDLLWVGHDK